MSTLSKSCFITFVTCLLLMVVLDQFDDLATLITWQPVAYWQVELLLLAVSAFAVHYVTKGWVEPMAYDGTFSTEEGTRWFYDALEGDEERLKKYDHT